MEIPPVPPFISGGIREDLVKGGMISSVVNVKVIIKTIEISLFIVPPHFFSHRLSLTKK
jgi:hypothetical protein